MAKKKILLFGGTFNPIHNGHMIVSRHVTEMLDMDGICLIPNGVPPHKKRNISPLHKYEMIKLAMQGEPIYDTTTYEIDKQTPSYTIETVRRYKNALGDSIDKPYWLIGTDNVDDIKNWYKIDELKNECIFVVGISAMTTHSFQDVHERTFEGFSIETVIIPHLEIRSTEIRERVKKGLSIRHFVPDAVEEYIGDHGLYRTD